MERSTSFFLVISCYENALAIQMQNIHLKKYDENVTVGVQYLLFP